MFDPLGLPWHVHPPWHVLRIPCPRLLGKPRTLLGNSAARPIRSMWPVRTAVTPTTLGRSQVGPPAIEMDRRSWRGCGVGIERPLTRRSSRSWLRRVSIRSLWTQCSRLPGPPLLQTRPGMRRSVSSCLGVHQGCMSVIRPFPLGPGRKDATPHFLRTISAIPRRSISRDVSTGCSSCFSPTHRLRSFVRQQGATSITWRSQKPMK